MGVSIAVYESVAFGMVKVELVKKFLEKEGLGYEEITSPIGHRYVLRTEIPFKSFKKLYKQYGNIIGSIVL